IGARNRRGCPRWCRGRILQLLGIPALARSNSNCLCLVFPLLCWGTMRKLFALVLFAACGGQTSSLSAPTTSLTYYRDVAPIMQARCTGCHQPGGIAPFSLLTFDDVYMQTARIKDAVVDKRIMPPLPPLQTDCQTLIDSRNMPDEERNMMADW